MALKALAARLDLVMVKPDKLVKNQTFQSGSGQTQGDKKLGKEEVPQSSGGNQKFKVKGPGPGELQPGQTASWKKDADLLFLQKQFREMQTSAEKETDVATKTVLSTEMAKINLQIKDKKAELRGAKAAQSTTNA
jgi:hypothetical protein